MTKKTSNMVYAYGMDWADLCVVTRRLTKTLQNDQGSCLPGLESGQIL